MPDLSKAVLVKRKDFTPEHAVFWFKPEAPFTFKPGQYCTIGLPGQDGKLIERPYSIVSAPHEEYIELFVELVPPPQGNLTPLLWKLNHGDFVFIRPRAKGVFTFDSSRPAQVMVATVTGVVPYISILRDYVYRGLSGHRFFVLQGASYWDEFVYDLELHIMSLKAEGGPKLVYVPTVSRPYKKDAGPSEQQKTLRNISWRGETGRVNTTVEKYLAQWGLVPEDTLVYLCGHPGMIEDVKARLAPRGWKIKEERFYK